MIAATVFSQTRIVPCASRVQRVNQMTSKSAFVSPRPVAAKALPDVSFIFDIAEGAPGTVDAPLPVVAGLAVVVSAAALLFFSLGLKPGTYFKLINQYNTTVTDYLPSDLHILQVLMLLLKCNREILSRAASANKKKQNFAVAFYSLF